MSKQSIAERQTEIAQFVHDLLEQVYVIDRPAYEVAAKRRGCTLESYTAAALAQGLRDRGYTK